MPCLPHGSQHHKTAFDYAVQSRQDDETALLVLLAQDRAGGSPGAAKSPAVAVYTRSAVALLLDPTRLAELRARAVARVKLASQWTTALTTATAKVIRGSVRDSSPIDHKPHAERARLWPVSRFPVAAFTAG